MLSMLGGQSPTHSHLLRSPLQHWHMVWLAAAATRTLHSSAVTHRDFFAAQEGPEKGSWIPASRRKSSSGRPRSNAMMAHDGRAAPTLWPRIILGSASSSRRGLMDELAQEQGFSYEVCTADIDEKAIRHEDPQHLVTRLSRAKAAAIRSKLQADGGGGHSGLLLTCDQVVVHEGRILEKPQDAAEARQFIAGYGRLPAQTISAVLCTNLDTGSTAEGIDVATIHFSPLPESSVEALIEEGSVLWCAGGLMVENALVQPHVTKMEGTLDSVMGLPKQLTLRLLRQALGSGS